MRVGVGGCGCGFACDLLAYACYVRGFVFLWVGVPFAVCALHKWGAQPPIPSLNQPIPPHIHPTTQNLPAELIGQFSTVEYELQTPPAGKITRICV